MRIEHLYFILTTYLGVGKFVFIWYTVMKHFPYFKFKFELSENNHLKNEFFKIEDSIDSYSLFMK